MYSKPNHNFWKKVFVELEMHKKAPYYYSRHMTIMFTTGPGILNRIYNKYKILLSLEHLPYKLFHPYGITSDIKMLKNIPSIFAVHIGYGSWETNDSKIFLFLYKEWRLLLFIMGVLIIPNFIKYIIHRKITNN
jgi:mannosyltransferase OCH1-like enzyme